MKKTLAILSIITLTGCMKKFGPDETMVMQGNDLRLPPEYELTAPKKVKTIKTEQVSVETQSQKLLLDSSISNQDDKNLNTWLLKNAGGTNRVKNIKQILKNDLTKEESAKK